ncbi:MAG: hypothetical protein ABI772_12135 [Bacteroidota bacterium]
MRSKPYIVLKLLLLFFIVFCFNGCSPKVDISHNETQIFKTADGIQLDSITSENQHLITNNTIQYLNQNGISPSPFDTLRYLYFKKNNKIIKRKCELYERVIFSSSQNLVAVFKRLGREERNEFTLYKLNGDSSITKTDTIRGSLVLADDGRFATVRGSTDDWEGMDGSWKFSLFDKYGRLQFISPEFFNFYYVSSFSKNGFFAMFGYDSLSSYDTVKLVIIDSQFRESGRYVIRNFGNKNFYPLKFDSEDNVIIKTYNLIERTVPAENYLEKYSLIISPFGEIIRRVEGWEEE